VVRKKETRTKKDHLLSYLHHARNAAEHGIQRITSRTSSNITLAPNARAFLSSRKKGGWDVLASSGEITFASDMVYLVRVHDDRYGDWFDPPTSRLGNDLTDISPAGIGTLGILYLEGMLSEARKL
jgi:hypothetical protein